MGVVTGVYVVSVLAGAVSVDTAVDMLRAVSAIGVVGVLMWYGGGPDTCETGGAGTGSDDVAKGAVVRDASTFITGDSP